MASNNEKVILTEKKNTPTNKKETKRTYTRFAYSQENLELAIQSVRNGEISANKASQQFHIPKGTLINKLHESTTQSRKMGPPTVLSPEEELRLKTWILSKAKLGFPMQTDDVKDAVQKILRAEKRETPFIDSRPGRKWFDLFLKRHPEVTRKNAEILSKARASVTEEGIRAWFQELYDYLKEENATDILLDGSRIVNLDETGVSTCPKTGKLLGEKGSKDFYKIASGPEKQSITVLCTFSANGKSIDPMILYPYVRIPRDIADSVPEGIAIGRSDSGWMTSATYYEYIANVLYPRLVERNTTFPILLLFDGHKSHINMELYDFCTEKKILLFCLFPNATHILQPCDVGIFRPLKVEWKKVVAKHAQSTSKPITKFNFAPLFQQAYEKAIKPETIMNSFAACGIFPFEPNNVDFNKCISTRRKELNNDMSTEISINVMDDFNGKILKLIESQMPHEITNAFQKAYDLKQQPNEELLLFNIWKNLKDCKVNYSDFFEFDVSSDDTLHNVSSQDVLTLSAEDSYDILSEIENQQNTTDHSDVENNNTTITSGNEADNTVNIEETLLDEPIYSNESRISELNTESVETTKVLTKSTSKDADQKDKTVFFDPKINIDKDLWEQHLHFPREEYNNNKTKTNSKSTTIYAITSDRWRDLQMEKMQLEIEEKKQKQKRQEERLAKKREKEQEKLEREKKKEASLLKKKQEEEEREKKKEARTLKKKQDEEEKLLKQKLKKEKQASKSKVVTRGRTRKVNSRVPESDHE